MINQCNAGHSYLSGGNKCPWCEIDRLREQLRIAQKAGVDRFRDEHRLRVIAREVMLGEEVCGIDLHACACAYASAFGRDEPNDDDYLAALRDQLDALIREQEGSPTAAAPGQQSSGP